jgi:hypothetical protein
VETLPNALLFLRRQPWPLIVYPDRCLRSLDLHAHFNRTIHWRIFDRVGDIVCHHLPNVISISQYGCPQITRALQVERALANCRFASYLEGE